VKVDRVAWPWLIRKFVDRRAEFHFVPAEQVMSEAQRLGATPFDVPPVELATRQECSSGDLKNTSDGGCGARAALGRSSMARILTTLWQQPEGAGLTPLRKISPPEFKSEHEINAAMDCYDALTNTAKRW